MTFVVSCMSSWVQEMSQYVAESRFLSQKCTYWCGKGISTSFDAFKTDQK